MFVKGESNTLWPPKVRIIHVTFINFLVIHCPTPAEPTNGFIYLPCKTYFGSQCTVGCASGYYIDGTEKITCNVHRVWQPENIICKGEEYL